MRERIKELMDAEGYTPARFADTLDVGRAIISHVLNGRNNPSLDLISKILEAFPNINPDWLLFGKGQMYRGGENINTASAEDTTVYDVEPNLFTQTQSQTLHQPSQHQPQNPTHNNITSNHSKTQPEKEPQIVEKVVYKEIAPKKITQIIIYYDDNTFEIFNH